MLPGLASTALSSFSNFNHFPVLPGRRTRTLFSMLECGSNLETLPVQYFALFAE
jgi:hypothetical protein